jgi:hypothetical protein
MPRSFRIDPALERRLCEVAAREGVPVSAVVREAIEQYCNAAPGNDTRTRLADVIGIVEGDGRDYSSRTGRAFTELLMERHRRRSADNDPH